MHALEKKHGSMRAALIKLTLASLLLFALVIGYFFLRNQLMRVMDAVLLFLLAIPINILCCIDASRAIAGQTHTSKSARILGAALGIPQAIIGIALFAVGAIYPFIGVHNIYVDMFAGHAASQDFLWVVISLLMLALGYFYLKESMWLVLGRRSFKGKPKNLPNKSV